MANRILKGLAIAAGTGLAMGLTSGRNLALSRTTVRQIPFYPASPAGQATPAATQQLPANGMDIETLNIDPLLERLERLEARMESISLQAMQPVPASGLDDYAETLERLEQRVEENTRELELLRKSIADAELRAAESVASVQRNVAQTRAELPAVVEKQITARVDELQKRFSAEIEQSNQRTLDTFERVIDEKIASRIGAIERALAEQGGSIDALSARTAETDSNLQRLVIAIEKLCERAQLVPPQPGEVFRKPQSPQPRQYEARLPFEAQLHNAMSRETPVPVIRNQEPAVEIQSPAPAFATDNQPAPKKSRFLFRNLVVAAFGLLGMRYLR